MSHQEKINFIAQLRDAVQSYQGFTSTEKSYANRYIHEWIGKRGELDTFIQKFSERSLDIQPFLIEKKFIQSVA